jgi:hypothetical protein
MNNRKTTKNLPNNGDPRRQCDPRHDQRNADDPGRLAQRQLQGLQIRMAGGRMSDTHGNLVEYNWKQKKAPEMPEPLMQFAASLT